MHKLRCQTGLPARGAERRASRRRFFARPRARLRGRDRLRIARAACGGSRPWVHGARGQAGGPARPQDQGGQGLRDGAREPGFRRHRKRDRRELAPAKPDLASQLGPPGLAGIRPPALARQERARRAAAYLSLDPREAPLRTGPLCGGRRSLPVGHRGQGGRAADLSRAGGVQGPGVGLCKFTTPGDEDVRSLHRSRAEGQGRGLSGLQDQPPAAGGRRRQSLPAGHGNLPRGPQGGRGRLPPDLRGSGKSRTARGEGRGPPAG